MLCKFKPTAPVLCVLVRCVSEWWCLLQTYVINPGDSLTTRCYYNNPSNADLKMGKGSDEEMCIDFLYYYPYQPTAGTSNASRPSSTFWPLCDCLVMWFATLMCRLQRPAYTRKAFNKQSREKRSLQTTTREPSRLELI